MKEALEENDGYLARWLLAALVYQAGKSVEAIKVIFDRAEGKVPQPIIGEDGGPVRFTLEIERANAPDSD